MKLDDIEKLPAEFDFVSKINMSGIVYHAKETKTGYTISWKASDDKGNEYGLSYSCRKIEFWKKLKVDDYMPIGVKENPTEDAVNFIKKQIEPWENTILLVEEGDQYDRYRKEYNDIIRNFIKKMKKGNEEMSSNANNAVMSKNHPVQVPTVKKMEYFTTGTVCDVELMFGDDKYCRYTVLRLELPKGDKTPVVEAVYNFFKKEFDELTEEEQQAHFPNDPDFIKYDDDPHICTSATDWYDDLGNKVYHFCYVGPDFLNVLRSIRLIGVKAAA